MVLTRMTNIFVIVVAAAALAPAQAVIGIQPASEPQAPSPATAFARKVEAAPPVLGYVTNGSATLYSVVGSVNNPQWGEPLTLPDQTSRAFLPPRQEFSLVASDAGLSVARLSRNAISMGDVIPHAFARPDKVAFSPSGETAALLSIANKSIQVVMGLPAHPRVYWSLSIADADELAHFTISDDADLLVAMFQNQVPVYSLRGAAWVELPRQLFPRCLDLLARIPRFAALQSRIKSYYFTATSWPGPCYSSSAVNWHHLREPLVSKQSWK